MRWWTGEYPHRLGGNCLLRFFALATGSYLDRASSGESVVAWKEEASSSWMGDRALAVGAGEASVCGPDEA